MKKYFRILLVVIVFAALMVLPVFAQGVDLPAGSSANAVVLEQPASPSLHAQEEVADPVLLYQIGLVSSAILYGLRFLAARYPKIKLSREWLSVLIYVVAFGLAVYWGGMAIPAFAAFSDPVSFISALLGWVNEFIVALAVPVSLATLLYNLILKRVLDGATAKYFAPSGALLKAKK